MTSVLFVCLGNICRSPLAEGVFRSLVEQAGLSDHFRIDSAGTGRWHIGDPPDPRSIEVAARQDIDISGQQAREIVPGDFHSFNIILAMDNNNLSTLRARAGAQNSSIRLFLDHPPIDVPDPYYDDENGFEEVYQMVKAGGEALLNQITDNSDPRYGIRT
ncbi:MAG: low molecular weight protein-tyrosine-phosphatase [Roseibium sp.]